jgi:hypothetical protein
MSVRVEIDILQTPSCRLHPVGATAYYCEMARRLGQAAVVILLVAAACTGGGSNRRSAPGHIPTSGAAANVVNQGGLIQPNPGSLTAVDGSGSNDVWAVGERHGASFRSRSLVAHWDGTA